MLTLVGQPGAVSAALLSRAADQLGTMPEVLSPGEAAEFTCSERPDAQSLRDLIGAAPVDPIVTPATRRRKLLLIADMDSTIVTSETLDELATYAGVGEHVAAITRRSMAGEIDFADALRERVALLKGLPLDALERTWAGVQLTPGSSELVATMRAHGAVAALVSGGFTWFTGRVSAALGFDMHRSNVLLDDGAALLGQVREPILDRHAKLRTLQSMAEGLDLALEDCLAVGDGANDLDMIRAAGLGVAYHAKPIVAEAAQVRVEHTNLRALLFMQGYHVSEFAR